MSSALSDFWNCKVTAQYGETDIETQQEPEKYLEYLNVHYIKCSTPKIPGCPATPHHILQFVRQHAVLAVLENSPMFKMIILPCCA